MSYEDPAVLERLRMQNQQVQVQQNQAVPPPLPSNQEVAGPMNRQLPMTPPVQPSSPGVAQGIQPQPVNPSQPQQPPQQPQAPQENPIAKFNQILMQMLQDSQKGIDNTQLFQQQRALQRAAIGRQSEITPEALRVLSPSQQAAIRSGKTGALEPEIDAISSQIKANDARLVNFEKLLDTARQLGETVQKSVVKAVTPEIIEGYRNMINAGGLPSSIPDEIRGEVISKMTPQDWSAWGEENRKGAAAASGLTLSQQANLETKIGNSFEQHVADARTALNNKKIIDSQLSLVESAVKSGASLAAPTTAMIIAFNKILDAASVVREGEFDRTAQGQSLLNRVEGFAQRLVQGGAGIGLSELRSLKESADALMDQYHQYIVNQAERVKNQATGYGLDINRILTPQDLQLLEGANESSLSDEEAYQLYLQMK